MPLAEILSAWEQRSNADFRLYLLTFTKAAVVCDSTVIPMTIPSKEHLFLRPYKMKNIVLSTIEQVRGNPICPGTVLKCCIYYYLLRQLLFVTLR